MANAIKNFHFDFLPDKVISGPAGRSGSMTISLVSACLASSALAMMLKPWIDLSHWSTFPFLMKRILNDLSESSSSTTPRVNRGELCTGNVDFFLSRMRTTSSLAIGPTERLNRPREINDLVMRTWKVVLKISIRSWTIIALLFKGDDLMLKVR